MSAPGPETSPRRALVIVREPSSERPSHGATTRRHHLLRAIARVAALDVFVMNPVDANVLDEMSTIYRARVGCVRSAMVPASPLGRMVQSLRHPGSPRRMARRDWQAARRDVRSWMGTYDLTVVELADDFRILARILTPPVVVDCDDRESDVARQVRGLPSRGPRQRRGPVRWALAACRRGARNLYLTLEEHRWRRVERFAVRYADRILVASSDDAVSAGTGLKTIVVANGVERRGAPAGSREVHTPPTIAFWGLMSYGPNRDGAEWLIEEVLPRVVSRVPAVRVLLIGRGSEQLRVPGDGRVMATGFVEALPPLLAETDVAVVPVRIGGGTRLKIIEAWANHLPVVSTSRGAYGLGAIHGENALLADDPESFAMAIAAAIEDQAVRDRLIANGAARAGALSWSAIETNLAGELHAIHARPTCRS